MCKIGDVIYEPSTKIIMLMKIRFIALAKVAQEPILMENFIL